MLGYYIVSFNGHYPIGAYALVVAPNRGHALKQFQNVLARDYPTLVALNGHLTKDDFKPIEPKYGVTIVSDGDY